jgi:tetratricopeptide (TPR) repeat protein
MDNVEGTQRTVTRGPISRAAACALACALAGGGCTSPTGAGAPGPIGSREKSEPSTPAAREGRALLPVPLPDVSKMTPSVQSQIRQAHGVLSANIDNRKMPLSSLADAYGGLGKLLTAADYPDAAEPYFLNARMLAPHDHRWPYYLAHQYRKRGEIDKARTFFAEALERRPDDVDTLVWLGDVALAQGRADEAEPRFARALSLEPTSLSARFGLGRTALARQEYQRAVEYLEEVLKRDPEAAGARYPLGLAYRGLGDSKKAEAHLRQRKNHEILPADPLLVELEELLESPQAYESRGIRALNKQQWPEAAALFRKGLGLAPHRASLRHRLGTAMFMIGDAAGAQAEFEQVVRASPDYFLAQYSLGVMLRDQGRHAEAIARFGDAVRARPGYSEARLGLATGLRRLNRAKESLTHYDQVLAENPQQTEARFGRAMALVQLGRYQEARDHLVAGVQAYPDQSLFAHGLARLLAAAPDDRVRNGDRAIALVGELLAKEQRTLELGETMAMALAAATRYEEAARVQRDLIRGAETGGLRQVVPRLAANLELYERRQPCRTPWPPGEIP